MARFANIDDQVEACCRIFKSDRRWTVVRGSDLEEGERQGLLKSNLTRRVDFALFMVEALENDVMIQKAPAITGCWSPSALTVKQAS